MYVSKEVKDVSRDRLLEARNSVGLDRDLKIQSRYGVTEEVYPYAVVNVEWLTARTSVTTILGYYPTKESALHIKALLIEEMDNYPEPYGILEYIEVWHLTDNEKSGE